MVEPDQSHAEGGAWREVEGVWRRVYGSFPEQGRSIEWHDFRLDEALDWGRSFHLESLEICLNFSGCGRLTLGGTDQYLGSGQATFYIPMESEVLAERESGQAHRFLTLELGISYLETQLRYVMDGVHPKVQKFCETGKVSPGAFEIESMPAQLLGLRMQLLAPPVNASAHGLWYESKITEILSHFLFRPEAPTELFCERHRRVNRERCERVLFLLERDMENPPNLEMLAKEVGCSPFYLSRLFAQETGSSIPAALRRLRIARAAAILLEGRSTVTDVAMQVGYSSLGAFNKAFVQQHGSSPAEFVKRNKSGKSKARRGL